MPTYKIPSSFVDVKILCVLAGGDNVDFILTEHTLTTKSRRNITVLASCKNDDAQTSAICPEILVLMRFSSFRKYLGAKWVSRGKGELQRLIDNRIQ
jgi:hypothetical protein